MSHAVTRPMQQADLEAVLHLQHQCYAPPWHEPLAAFESKLRASPDTCWVVQASGPLLAYLVSLPIAGDGLPALHAAQWLRPARPDWLYLHDLSIAPQARGTGVSRALLDAALGWAQQAALTHVGLIAVQDSVAFWQKMGFGLAWPTPHVSADKLRSFGAGAQYMQRPTPRPVPGT